ncbi:hypothetical protein N7468_000945 [Penicillium chermesinum]|uniref:Uncharacterized protein n=1 Tax=Penicillium chermesinum TaxID=63820 RepID=A0A9W9TWJ9_9EURO|nr:uncharacterized protein N7468_000945 [Penicillium chermesinum]KAJ5245962.1 hypothetical protein N7468_000945 [Penicillium chermesinum]
MAICITFGTHVPRLALSELGAEYLRDRNQPIIPLATHKYKKLISGSIRPDITPDTRPPAQPYGYPGPQWGPPQPPPMAHGAQKPPQGPPGAEYK